MKSLQIRDGWKWFVLFCLSQFSVGNNSIDDAFTLQHEGVNQYVSTCVLNISSPNTVIYFTYNLVFGTVATVGIMNNYTITRIA